VLFPRDARISHGIDGAGRNGFWIHGFRNVSSVRLITCRDAPKWPPRALCYENETFLGPVRPIVRQTTFSRCRSTADRSGSRRTQRPVPWNALPRGACAIPRSARQGKSSISHPFRTG
jgi:hypothetical protein